MMQWNLFGRVAGFMASLIAATFMCVTAYASSEERATYRIALAGIEIADLEIAVRRDGDRYAAELTGSYSVLFWSGGLSSRSTGKIDATGPSPIHFETNSKSDEPSTTIIQFRQSEGPVDWKRTPAAPAEWTEGRIPLQKIHLLKALDPVSAIASSALGSIDANAPDVCDRAVRIFTGTTVFELQFMGVVSGTQDRVTCAVGYRPLSGHREDSSSVARLSKPGSITVAFDRLGSGVWVPARVTLPTRVGQLVVERT